MDSLWANSARSVASSQTAFWLSVACCLLVSGCNNSGRQMQTDLYQRELRLQEDEIYRLEDYIEEYQGIVRGYRCKVEDLERDLRDRQNERRNSSPPSLSPAAEELPTPAATRPDPPSAIDLSEMPEIETPDPTELSPPAEATTPLNVPSADEEPPLFNGADASPIGSPANTPTSQVALATTTAGDRRSIETATLVEAEPSPPNPYPLAKPAPYVAPATNTDPFLRLGIDTTNEPGVFVAVIATVEGEPLSGFAGEASIMLTDPTIDGRRRRIARWDFTTEEVTTATGSDDSFLRLPVVLPTDVPDDRPLRVWVRLVDEAGGKRLQAAEVQFIHGTLELTNPTDKLAADAIPQRLPPTIATRPLPMPTESIAESQPSEGWRPASDRSLNRRVDTAVAPASFEADW